MNKYKITFNPPAVQAEIPIEFTGTTIAFSYQSYEEETVYYPQTDLQDQPITSSIYNVTKEILNKVHPNRRTEILLASSFFKLAKEIDQIDFLIIPRFISQVDFFESDNYLIVASPSDTKYNHPNILTLDLNNTSYDHTIEFLTSFATRLPLSAKTHQEKSSVKEIISNLSAKERLEALEELKNQLNP